MQFFKLPSFRRLALLLLVGVPVLSWAVVKPLRVIAPTLAGVSCPNAQVCIDDLSRLEEATALRDAAFNFVSERLGPLPPDARVVFCATQTCAEAFGLGRRSAVTVGGQGTVIGPRAWKPYYVRHELIHQRQNAALGTASTFLKPQWFVEGMAYDLSEDPRLVLDEPWQTDRVQFRAWYAKIGAPNVWTAAGQL